jgi:hypothetical protein
MTAADCITRDATAVDAATNDSEVENAIQKRPPGVRQFILATSLSLSTKSQPNTKATEKGTTEALVYGAVRPSGIRRGSGIAETPPCATRIIQNRELRNDRLIFFARAIERRPPKPADEKQLQTRFGAEEIKFRC